MCARCALCGGRWPIRVTRLAIAAKPGSASIRQTPKGGAIMTRFGRDRGGSGPVRECRGSGGTDEKRSSACSRSSKSPSDLTSKKPCLCMGGARREAGALVIFRVGTYSTNAPYPSSPRTETRRAARTAPPSAARSSCCRSSGGPSARLRGQIGARPGFTSILASYPCPRRGQTGGGSEEVFGGPGPQKPQRFQHTGGVQVPPFAFCHAVAENSHGTRSFPSSHSSRRTELQAS